MAENMSVVLKSNAIKQLQQDLCLTDEQKMKATSKALMLSSDPKLAKCDPFSIAKFCFETARYDFIRDDSVYPVPYSNKIQAQISYKGFTEIAMRSNKYKSINAVIVLECDRVRRNRVTGAIEVDFCEDYKKSQTSKVFGYYALAIYKDGSIAGSKFMSKEEVAKHGKRFSKATNGGVWATDFDAMALKTVIKQLYKYLDVTPEMEAVTKTDQIVFGKQGERDRYLDNPSESDIIDVSDRTETTVTNRFVKEEEPKQEEAKKTPTPKQTDAKQNGGDDDELPYDSDYLDSLLDDQEKKATKEG